MYPFNELMNTYDEIHAFCYGVFRVMKLFTSIDDLPDEHAIAVRKELHYYYAGQAVATTMPAVLAAIGTWYYAGWSAVALAFGVTWSAVWVWSRTTKKE